ncbi:hypothetical protein ACFFQF_30185 [Haladaptatus pallidirubidus]|uniref:Uncharacterized protein n=1 Tax=Haladaptatus pallidirubidus TaxID=1008152 RepID=A0AAV3UI37_9EURY|nr:hypothetical protein [Haladaptatus pallidirubidus]
MKYDIDEEELCDIAEFFDLSPDELTKAIDNPTFQMQALAASAAVNAIQQGEDAILLAQGLEEIHDALLRKGYEEDEEYRAQFGDIDAGALHHLKALTASTKALQDGADVDEVLQNLNTIEQIVANHEEDHTKQNQ